MIKLGAAVLYPGQIRFTEVTQYIFWYMDTYGPTYLWTHLKCKSSLDTLGDTTCSCFLCPPTYPGSFLLNLLSVLCQYIFRQYGILCDILCMKKNSQNLIVNAL